MALNCKLDRNISLSQPGQSVDDCNGQDISIGVGGISSPVLVYNISDVPSLTFDGDNRSDYSLYVDTINSIGQFYRVDHTDATYNEEYDEANHKWTHTLTLTVGNIQPVFEDILADAVNGKYLVCFRPNGAEDYRMFGWQYGATLDYSMNITSDSLGYTITFEDTSEYALMTVDRDNFGNKDKVFEPLWKPLYDVYFCEQDQYGYHTGYIICMYVVKVNAAGQPLGSDNKLCQWTGKKQDAYKINTISSDGGYNIVGTYTKDATFDGKPVMVLDYEKCPANVDNSIYINSKKVETINLNSTVSAGTFTITSTDDWMMVTDPQYVTISPVEGEDGDTICGVHHNGVGGCESIEFMNKVSTEIVILNVCVNLITVGDDYTFECSDRNITIVPTVEGCSSAYTYTVSPEIDNEMDENGYIHLYPETYTDGTYTLTLTHSCDQNEVKTITVKIICNSTDPDWQKQSSYCETDVETGEYTGYRIDVKQDVNPYSSTYGEYETVRVGDNTCVDSPAIWVLTDNYCELENGITTGYYVSVYTDQNEDSPTYMQTKEEKVMNRTKCPEVDPDPIWVPDETFEGYCEEIYYEPGHVLGNSGYWIGQEIDDNRYSPTYRQTRETKTLSDDCPVPDTDPIIEDIVENCELEYDSDDNLVMNGYIVKTGLDKNVFSPTYLTTTTVREYDPITCPPSGDVPPPEPTGCTAFIVDGGHWDGVPQTGASACDSAFLYVDGTAMFLPATAEQWVTIRFKHWDEDPHTYQNFCTVYSDAPCVAESFFRHAGVTPDQKPEICGGETGVPMPQLVIDSITGNTEYTHALGTIWYDVAPNPNTDSRTCTIKWYVDDMSEECMSAEFRITQDGTGGGGGGCDCTDYKVRSLSPVATVPYSTGSTEYHVGNYTAATGCDQEIYKYGLNSGSDFLGSFRFSGGKIYAKVKAANASTSTRQAQYIIKQGNCEGYVNINQQAAPVPHENKFEWNWEGHETSYSVNVAGNANAIELIQFTSYYNSTQPNAILSSDVPWIITNNPAYTNNNELRPNVNNTLYIQSNSSLNARTGTLTLTQKGTSNKITLIITQGAYVPDCTITQFNVPNEVCKGDSLVYNLAVADTRCTNQLHIYLYDANGVSHSSTCTPVQGRCTGHFDTSTMAVGDGVIPIVVGTTPTNYPVKVKDCTQPPTPTTITVTFRITNSIGEMMCVNYVDLTTNSGKLPISLINYECLQAGSTTNFNITLPISLAGTSYLGATLRDTAVQHRQYNTNLGLGQLTDGAVISMNATSVIS